MPLWPDGPPSWFRPETLKELGGLVVNYSLDDTSRWYGDGDSPPIGANMGFRSHVLEELGPFQTDLGVAGNRRLSGEDTEMSLRARRARIKGYYVADAVCHHIADACRTTLLHAFQYGLSRGASQVVLDPPHAPRGSRTKAVEFALRSILQMVKGRRDRMRICVYHAGIQLGRCRASRGGIDGRAL